MSDDDVRVLAEAYRASRRRINHLVLQEQPGVTDHDELAQQHAAVSGIWDRFMEQQ